MSLGPLGWSDDFELYDSKVENAARITAVHRSHLRAVTANGEINLHYPPKFPESLAVGDWVITGPLYIDDQKQSAALVEELIPRKSKISRVGAGDRIEEQVIAANIDIVFIVTSINQDFNLNRLQRYILLIKKGLAKPVILLSKADLKPSHTQIIEDLSKQVGEEILIIPVSVLDKTGVDQIKDLTPEGFTSVFVGSSGVGKSSLTNFLLGEEVQVVKEVRNDDDKGRHTTTSRQMFFIPNGGMIIDTPGIRGVSVFGSEEHLSETFHDVEELMTQCKFSDCKHSSEPGCAITNALKNKTLEESQWENYKKLSKEIAANNDKLKKQKASQFNKKGKKSFRGKQ